MRSKTTLGAVARDLEREKTETERLVSSTRLPGDNDHENAFEETEDDTNPSTILAKRILSTMTRNHRQMNDKNGGGAKRVKWSSSDSASSPEMKSK